jgi:hypothetical protein
MPKFTIDYDSKVAAPEAFQKIKEFLGKEDGIRRFDPKVECNFDEPSQSCQIKGAQFKAELKIASVSDGSKVSITVDLPLLLTPFKSKVQETLLKQLSKYLG